jgi:hypothetical protein
MQVHVKVRMKERRRRGDAGMLGACEVRRGYEEVIPLRYQFQFAASRSSSCGRSQGGYASHVVNSCFVH